MLGASSKDENIVKFEKRKKTGEELPPPEKIPIAEFYRAIADAINRENPLLAPFHRKFLTVAPDDRGSKLILEELENGEVRYVSKEAVTDAILAYTQREQAGKKEYSWTRRGAGECAAFWQGLTDPQNIDDIAPVRWLGEKGRTFRRLPWEYRVGDFPTWKKLLESVQNAQALVEYIGSIIVPGSYQQQYLWLRGPGGDGKGAINRWLERMLGSSYCSRQPPRSEDKFWTYGLIGKRLACLPDCDNSRFVGTGLWKALTGGDPIECEAKGSMSFTAKLRTKFIVLSQKRPQISSERADQRRLIYCELTGSWDDLTAEDMASFEERLWDEGGAFLSHCLTTYYTRYPHGGPIKSVLTQEMEGWVSSLEEEFEVFFAHYFIIDQTKRQFWVSPSTLQEVMVGTFKTRARCIEWVEWLERKHCVRKGSVKLPCGKVIQSYKGLILKSQSGAV